MSAARSGTLRFTGTLAKSNDGNALNDTARCKLLAIGGRGSYAVTKNFKPVAEAGFPDSGHPGNT